jgi:hypothetical protein
MADDYVSYTMASSKWRRSGFVEIVSAYETPIASFPISFLETCGDNTWHYIDHVVSLVIEVDTQHPGGVVDADGLPVNSSDAPVAGSFRYLEQGASPLC